MNWTDVTSRLVDVPSAYLRPGTTFQWLQNSYTIGLVAGTAAIDGLSTQYTLQNASGNWLGVWGALFNLPRGASESDTAYKARITYTLALGRGTPAAVQAYITNISGVSATVTENFATTSWSANLSGATSAAQIASIATSLVNVRPAGVQFLPIYAPSGGLYLGTINYLGAPSVTGAYLTSASNANIPVISASTNPTKPTLPTVYLNDPILNS